MGIRAAGEHRRKKELVLSSYPSRNLLLCQIDFEYGCRSSFLSCLLNRLGG
jgi:hypothetical protein